MKASLLMGSAAVVAVGILGVVRGVSGEVAPPTASSGLSGKVVGVLPLAPEIDGIGARQLRVRIATLAPGGVLALHSHKDRPSVELVLKGTAREFRGDMVKDYREGESIVAGKDVTHWWRNEGSEPAVVVAADIFNPAE